MKDKTKNNTKNNTFDMQKIDPESVNQFKLSMTPNAIPDMTEMLQTVNELLDYIESPQMKHLENHDFKLFETMIYGKFNSRLPMKVISLMVEGDRYDHLDNLLNMFETLRDVKDGKKNMQDEFQKFNENLNNKYIYDKFGGKEKFEEQFTGSKQTQ